MQWKKTKVLFWQFSYQWWNQIIDNIAALIVRQNLGKVFIYGFIWASKFLHRHFLMTWQPHQQILLWLWNIIPTHAHAFLYWAYQVGLLKSMSLFGFKDFFQSPILAHLLSPQTQSLTVAKLSTMGELSQATPMELRNQKKKKTTWRISIFLFHKLTHSLQNLLPKGSAVYALFGSLENFGTSIANIVYRVLFFF